MVATWHGHAGPYSPDGFLSEQQMASIARKYQGNDGVAAIEKSIQTLSDPKAGKWEKAFMLRVLLHVVGDIHCPMHCIQRFSEHFPEGDKGGGRFQLSGPEQLAKKNLHSLWDSILLLDNTGMNSRPLQPDTISFIEEMARRNEYCLAEIIFFETALFSMGICFFRQLG